MTENENIKSEAKTESDESQRETLVAKTYRNGRIKRPVIVKKKNQVYETDRDPARDDWVEVESIEEAVKTALIHEHEKYGHDQIAEERIEKNTEEERLFLCPLCIEEARERMIESDESQREEEIEAERRETKKTERVQKYKEDLKDEIRSDNSYYIEVIRFVRDALRQATQEEWLELIDFYGTDPHEFLSELVAPTQPGDFPFSFCERMIWED
ncbi:MAG: hypothetical protein R6U52_02150, partial [Kosmotogaceae bacterium]